MSSEPTPQPAPQPGSQPRPRRRQAADAGPQQDPGDSAPITDPMAMRALAHPVRMALIELLSVVDTLTATQASEVLGESPANCAFHLRTLAKYGFVEEAGGGRGRERPWKLGRPEDHDQHEAGRPAGRHRGRRAQQAWLERWMERARRAFGVGQHRARLGGRDRVVAQQHVPHPGGDHRTCATQIAACIDRTRTASPTRRSARPARCRWSGRSSPPPFSELGRVHRGAGPRGGRSARTTPARTRKPEEIHDISCQS